MSTNKNRVPAKRSQKHSTFIESVGPVVHVLEKMHSVRTYVLGVITQKGRVRKIRVQIKSGAIRIVVSGNGATQQIWVYPHDGSLVELVAELRNYQDVWRDYECVFPQERTSFLKQNVYEKICGMIMQQKSIASKIPKV